MQKAVQVGVGVLVIRDGRVLLGKRLGAHGAATWALPGGHMEFGESLCDCALRELQEESGLVGSATRQVAFTDTVFEEDSKHYVTLFVEVLGVSGEPVNCEPDKCEAWHWCALDDLPQPLFPPLQWLMASEYRPATHPPGVA